MGKLVSLNLQTLTTSIDEHEDTHELSLWLDGGVTDDCAELVPGAAGWTPEALAALEAHIEVAGRLLALLRIRAGSRRPFPDGEPVTERATPSVNLGQPIKRG